MEYDKTGAATLLIHMLDTMVTSMLVNRTVRGRVPALLSTTVDRILAIWYFERAAAMVKPPSNSIITGVHMAEKMYTVAAFASRRRRGSSSEQAMRSTTTRNGTKSDVTKRGIT
jgi:hypothetical protein